MQVQEMRIPLTARMKSCLSVRSTGMDKVIALFQNDVMS